MKIEYRIATKDYIDILTELRVEALIAANELDVDQDMTAVKITTKKYFEEKIGSEDFFVVMAFDCDRIVATGAVSFYNVMPTYHNVSGRKAYVMNMYTKLEYRRKKIAENIMKILLDEIQRQNIVEVTLEATDMGKVLYEKCGFTFMKREMEWTNREVYRK